MALADVGIVSDDFDNNEWTDFGQSISHVPVTITEDWRGSKTNVFTGTATITAVFHKRDITFIRNKDGIRQLAPAFLMHKQDSGIKRGDKVIIGTGTGSEWKVHNVINRRNVYQFSDLYLFE